MFQAFPKRGTALIAASARGEPALAPEGQPLTMFTGGFVQTVVHGLKGQQRELSFRDVFQGTRARIVEGHGSGAAIPVIHAPDRGDGDISTTPFFKNRAYLVASHLEPTVADLETFEAAIADADRPLMRTRLAAMDTLAELFSTTQSNPLRLRIAKKIADVRRSDDSNTVRTKGRDLLEAFHDQLDALKAGEQADGNDNRWILAAAVLFIILELIAFLVYLLPIKPPIIEIISAQIIIIIISAIVSLINSAFRYITDRVLFPAISN